MSASASLSSVCPYWGPLGPWQPDRHAYKAPRLQVYHPISRWSVYFAPASRLHATPFDRLSTSGIRALWACWFAYSCLQKCSWIHNRSLSSSLCSPFLSPKCFLIYCWRSLVNSDRDPLIFLHFVSPRNGVMVSNLIMLIIRLRLIFFLGGVVYCNYNKKGKS